jgi:transposase-like protein
MARQIRALMGQDSDKLTGIVEVDETYVGGHRGLKNRYSNKTAIIGATEKYGRVKAQVLDEVTSSIAIPFIKSVAELDSTIHTDESRIYTRVKRTFEHKKVNHSSREYVRNGVHTNSIEGFWGQLKRSIDGTYHCVSPKYLQTYVNEFVFRYNFRDVIVYFFFLERASTLS